MAKPVVRARHHVAVVAEDRERVRRDGARGDVDHRRAQLARDLEHVRDHQQQALGRREARPQGPRWRAPCKVPAAPASHCSSITSGTVSTGCACRRAPAVRRLTHRRRRRDRVDREHLGRAYATRATASFPSMHVHCCANACLLGRRSRFAGPPRSPCAIRLLFPVCRDAMPLPDAGQGARRLLLPAGRGHLGFDVLDDVRADETGERRGLEVVSVMGPRVAKSPYRHSEGHRREDGAAGQQPEGPHGRDVAGAPGGAAESEIPVFFANRMNRPRNAAKAPTMPKTHAVTRIMSTSSSRVRPEGPVETPSPRLLDRLWGRTARAVHSATPRARSDKRRGRPGSRRGQAPPWV